MACLTPVIERNGGQLAVYVVAAFVRAYDVSVVVTRCVLQLRMWRTLARIATARLCALLDVGFFRLRRYEQRAPTLVTVEEELLEREAVFA